MKSTLYSIITFSLLLFSASCGSGTKPSEEAQSEKPEETPTSIRLSAEQVKAANLGVGKIETRLMSGTITANGVLDVPPQNLVSVSVPIGGYIRQMEMLEGMHVHKGDLLAVLENPDYIQMQQDYMDFANQLEFAKADFERQEDLAKDNVNTQKVFQQAKSSYKSLQAKVLGLKEKLQLLHLPVAAIQSGKFQSSVRLTSPIDGYVSAVNFNTGQFADPAAVVLKLVDTRHIHAEITVFEKDIARLKKGQAVRLFLPNERKPREAKVFLIGKSIGPNRDVRVHCHLEEEDVELLPGMFVKAEIITAGTSQTAVPEESILIHNDKNYVFLEGKKEADGSTAYSLVPVEKTGGTNDGWIGVSLPTETGPNPVLVVKNARTLLAAMFNTEEEE